MEDLLYTINEVFQRIIKSKTKTEMLEFLTLERIDLRVKDLIQYCKAIGDVDIVINLLHIWKEISITIKTREEPMKEYNKKLSKELISTLIESLKGVSYE